MGVWKFKNPGDGQWYIVDGPIANGDHGALSGLTDDDHLQYAIIVVSGTEPVSPRVGTVWVPEG